jgi:DICT domain-containing protein
MDLRTPYAVVTSVEHPQPVTKRELVRISRRMEAAALAQPPRALAASLQDSRFLTTRTREVYRRLAGAGAQVTLLARGLHGWLDPGVRGVDLSDDDPLVDEWVVVLPGEGHPAVLAATDLRQPAHDELDRDFVYAVSSDPEVVAACAALLARPAGTRPA